MNRATVEAIATQIEELSDGERAELFGLFVVDVERAHAVAEMQTFADEVEAERSARVSPFKELRL